MFKILSLAGLAAAQETFLAKEVTDADPWGKLNWKPKIDTNERPLIGILSQTLETSMQNDTRFENYTSYIMGAYVKFMEEAGAQVVPIVYGEPHDVTVKKLENIDGVLLPGGDGDNWELGQFVFEKVKEFNDDGHFYPAWGTCLGYENLVGYTATTGNSSWSEFPIDTASLPLKFTVPPFKTRMYEGLGAKAFEFERRNFTYNSHAWGLKPETFETDAGLKEFWDVTAVSLMPNNGTAFVASIEAKDYPIFGTQYHPEKPSELWVDGRAINHEWESIELQRHFGKLLVGMARTNTNSFGNFKQTSPHLVQNFPVIETEDMADVYVFA